MSQSTALFVVAGVVLLLIPLVPRMIALRVAVLRFLHLNRLAGWHERHTEGITLAVRIILAALAVICVYLGATAP